MACSRLVGLEKGKRAFYGCFQVSAAGWFMYIYARARTRKGFGLGRAFPFANKFRKQNKSARLCSDTLTSLENKTRARCLFRKLNNGLSVGRVFLGRASPLLSDKRQTVAGSFSVYVHTHARVSPFLSLSLVL